VEFPEKKVDAANYQFCQKQYRDLFKRTGWWKKHPGKK
jgi:hypothetical protein